MSLDTLANIKTHLGVSGSSDDTLLTQLQASADTFVQEFCGRNFEGGSFTEDFDGAQRTILLRNYPVASVSSVKVDPARGFGAETALGLDDYLVHGDRGLVQSLDGAFVTGVAAAPGAVRIAYSTATDAVPAAVKRAGAELVGHWYRQVKTHISTGQLNLTIATDGSEYPWGQATGYRIPEGVLQLLRPYRVPGV